MTAAAFQSTSNEGFACIPPANTRVCVNVVEPKYLVKCCLQFSKMVLNLLGFNKSQLAIYTPPFTMQASSAMQASLAPHVRDYQMCDVPLVSTPATKRQTADSTRK